MDIAPYCRKHITGKAINLIKKTEKCKKERGRREDHSAKNVLLHDLIIRNVSQKG